MSIIDTSCLIYFIKVRELELLRKLFTKAIITPEVHHEMTRGVEGLSELQKALETWISIQQPQNASSITTLSEAESLSMADASIILLAMEKEDFLISNDAALIRAAKIKGVECWRLTSCIIEAVKKKIISKKKAQEILYSLISKGMYLDNRVYADLLEEINHL